jgi:hypothetical protein
VTGTLSASVIDGGRSSLRSRCSLPLRLQGTTYSYFWGIFAAK